MPNSPAFDIASHLIDNEIASLSKTNKSLPFISVAIEPDIKDRTLITVYDAFGKTSNPRFSRDQPTIQVRVKAPTPNGYQHAYAAQQAVKDLLLGMYATVINGTNYAHCVQVVDISSLAADANNRPILVATYNFTRDYDSPNRLPIE